MGVKIHPTAHVSPGAELGDGVEVAEHAIIRDEVVLAENVYVGPSTIIEGPTSIGEGTKILFAASLGLPPQDLKYRGEKTELIIGKENVIREFVTIHRGTKGGGGKTIIGNNNLLMAYTHVAHDCKIGNNVILANLAQIGGHVLIEDMAILGGMVAVHQFVRIGKLAMIGASSLVLQDVLPFALVSGNPARVRDINRIGMRRKNYPREKIDAVHKAIKLIAHSGLALPRAIQKIKREVANTDEVEHIIEFVENKSSRGIMRGERCQ